MAQFIRFDVKNGLWAKFWYDPWFPLGRLLPIARPSRPGALGIPLGVVVAKGASNHAWHLRSRIPVDMIPIVQCLSSTLTPTPQASVDIPLWRSMQSEFGSEFSSLRTWELLRSHSPQVTWFHLFGF